jgi:hypothetical protein
MGIISAAAVPVRPAIRAAVSVMLTVLRIILSLCTKLFAQFSPLCIAPAGDHKGCRKRSRGIVRAHRLGIPNVEVIFTASLPC